MDDGSIILGVDIDARKAEEKIQKLVNELAKLKIDNSNISIKLREIEREAYRCEQHILRLKNSLKNANDKTVIDSINQEIKASENYIKTLTDEYSKVLAKKLEIKEAIKEINKEIGNVRKEKIDALEESHRRAEQAARKHAQAESKLRENLNKIISLPPIQFSWNKILKPSIQFSWDKILKPSLNWLKSTPSHDFAPDLNDYKIAFNEHFFEPLIKPIYQRCLPAFQRLGQGFSWVKDRLSGLGQGFSWIKGHFANASNSIGSISRTFQNFGSGISRVFSTLSSFGSQALGWISRLTSRIFYLASSAFVFNVISAGFRALSRALQNVIMQDAGFVTSLNNIKANLMTAFYPIYQAALPALRALGQMLTWLTGLLARFMAMLTGTSVSANQQGAKQMYIKSSLGNKANTRAYNTHVKSQARADKVKARNVSKAENYESKIAEANNKDNISKSANKAYDSAGKSAEDNAKKLAKFDKAATKSRKELAKFDKIDVLKQDKDKIPKEIIPKVPKEIIPKVPKVSIPKEPKYAELPEVAPFIPNMPVLEGFKQNLESIQIPPLFENIFENISKFIERLKEPLKNISFENLNRELGNLWEALLKLGVGQAGERLLWLYDNVLVPLAQWTIEDLLPNFLKVLTSCLEAIEPIVKEANEQLGMLWDVFLKPAAEWAGAQITEFLGNLANWIKDVGDAIKDNQLLLESLSAFLVGLSSATLIVALAKLAAGIWGVVTATIAWGAAMLANPMTWVILGIAALIAIIILCIKHWDDIKAALGDFWERAKKIWEKLGKKFEEIKKKLGNLSGDLGELFENTIKLLSKIWNFLKPFIKWILDVAIDFLLTNFENMSVTLANIIGDITDAIDGITKFLSGLIDFITGVFTGDWDKAWSGLGKMFDGFVQTIKASINILIDFINSMINAITGGINVAIRGINKIGFDLPDWLGGHHFGLSIPEIPENALNIPKLAQGSVLKGGDPFLAWVNDQPRGQTNIETPLDTIVKAFKAVSGNNSNQNIVIEASGDINSIIREFNFRLKNENKRIGTEIMVQSGAL